MEKTILFPTDFSDCNTKITDYAIEFAINLNAKLYFCHVVKTTNPDGDPFDSSQFKEEIQIKLKDAKKKSEAGLLPFNVSDLKWDLVILYGDTPAEEIIEYAEKKEFSFILLSTHGKTGLKRFLIGSTAERVVRHSTVPVLTINTRKFCEK